MSSFLIIMAVILWVGFKAYRKVKTEFVDPAETDKPHQQPARPAYESLFEERTSSSATMGSPYFTYESGDQPFQSAAQQASEVVESEPSIPSEAPAFDLRQAVIYQTILTNNYISDYQHQ